MNLASNLARAFDKTSRCYVQLTPDWWKFNYNTRVKPWRVPRRNSRGAQRRRPPRETVRNRVFMTRPWTEHRTADDYAHVVHRYGFPGIYKIAPVSPLSSSSSSSASPRDDAWTKKSVAGSASSASDRKWRTSGEIRLHACRMRAENEEQKEEEEEEETLNRDTWKWVASRISRGFDNLITRRGGIFQNFCSPVLFCQSKSYEFLRGIFVNRRGSWNSWITVSFIARFWLVKICAIEKGYMNLLLNGI